MTDQPNLASALAAFQAVIPRIGKDNLAVVKSDKGNYKYAYADLSDISAKVLPLLAKNGLSFSAKPTLNAEGKFVLEYTLRHTSGEKDVGQYPLSITGTPQQVGSLITYARRYALCAVTGVTPDEDDDGEAASQVAPAQHPASNGERHETTPAAKPAAKTPEQIAAGLVDNLLAVDTADRAEVGVAYVNRSGAKDVDVSGLLGTDLREALDIRDGDVVVLADLATLVVDYVAKHKRSVKAAAVPA